MQDLDDNTLLQKYVEKASEEAFATLVTRHVNKVYSVALRHTRNPHSAEDITQAVFVILAKKAPNLIRKVILSGWLYQTARLTALTFIRSEIRRARREQEAHMQTSLNETETDLWPQIVPLLDNAVAGLSETDRHAVVLRFFDGKSLREVGQTMGVSEGAAKMRISRSVEKLRGFMIKRGVVLSAADLTTMISTNSVQAAPVALAKAATALALAKGATASSSILTLSQGALKIMAWTKAKTALVSVVVASLAVYSVMQHQTLDKQREQNESLQKQLAQLQTENGRLAAKQRPPSASTPHLPAPSMPATPGMPAWPAEDFPATNLYTRLKDKHPHLTREQVESYLKTSGRNAPTLLAAFRTSFDEALLKEAMQKYPHDPQVAFEATIRNYLSPEEQRAWLNKFEQSAPDNAMANYLSAANYFASGQPDQALRELGAVSGKSMDDYSATRVQDDVEAYLAAGYSMADAKTIASMELALPQLSQLKHLGLNTIDLANAYRQANDPASAQAVLQMAANLGQRYSNPSPGEATVSQFVGLLVERNALQAMEANAPYGDSGGTVQDRLNQLAQQTAALKDLNNQAESLLPSLSDQDWIIYKDRWLMFGEKNAEQWVVNKYGPHQQ